MQRDQEQAIKPDPVQYMLLAILLLCSKFHHEYRFDSIFALMISSHS
jgi:hypothetical protein